MRKHHIQKLAALGFVFSLSACGPLLGDDLGSDNGAQTLGHAAKDKVEAWMLSNTFEHSGFTTEGLLAEKRRLANSSEYEGNSGPHISLFVPLYIDRDPDDGADIENAESIEIEKTLESLSTLLENYLLDDIIVIAENNSGKAVQAAMATAEHMTINNAGDRVHIIIGNGLAEAEPAAKMGVAYESAFNWPEAYEVGETSEAVPIKKPDILVFFDPDTDHPFDTDNYGTRFVTGTLGPLLSFDHIDFVKGFSEHPIEQNAVAPTGGGRITEITARPLLNMYYPELAGFIQPLSGEMALRQKVINDNPNAIWDNFVVEHGARVGLLIDSWNQVGLDHLAQVNLKKRPVANLPLPLLSENAFGIVDSIMLRAARDGIISFEKNWPSVLAAPTGSRPPNRSMLRFRPITTETDPDEPTFGVTLREMEKIPANRPHLAEGKLGGWISSATPTTYAGKRTFNHLEFLDPDVVTNEINPRRLASPDQFDRDFNLGGDVDLVKRAVAPLVAQKQAAGLTVSVGLPALNEGKTISAVIKSVLPLREAGLIDQLLLIDSNSIPLRLANSQTAIEMFAAANPDMDPENYPEIITSEERQIIIGREGEISVAEGGIDGLLVDPDGPFAGTVSISGTRERAEHLGVDWVIHQHTITDELSEKGQATEKRGKGETLWKSMAVLTGDIICWIDTDIQNPSPRFVYGTVGPLLYNPDVQYVKGFYQRPISIGGQTARSGGGRVTELMARPTFNYLFPELAGLLQPLSGEYAGRREALMNIGFYVGYGVETGHLIDIAAKYGMQALAQTDLEVRKHTNQPLQSLSKMGFGIGEVVMTKAVEFGRIRFNGDFNHTMWRLKPRALPVDPDSLVHIPPAQENGIGAPLNIPGLTGPEAANLRFIPFAHYDGPEDAEIIQPDFYRPPMSSIIGNSQQQSKGKGGAM